MRSDLRRTVGPSELGRSAPSRPGPAPSWIRSALALAVLSAAAAGGCTEDLLTGVDPDSAPGDAAATIEIVLSADQLPAWRDTTFTGYALPLTSGIRLVSAGGDLRARVLARFSTIPDSVFLDDERLAVELYENARLRLAIDTTESVVPEAGAELTVHALTRGFVEREASWSLAAQGEPWTAPGGDFAQTLGTLQLDSLEADTVFVPLSVDADSLLKAWLAADGEPGIALVTGTAGATFTVDQVVLAFDAKPVGRDTLLETLRSPTPSTFIFDPETPPPAGALRIGGLPAARAYFNFRLPESVNGVRLRGSQVNRATLLLSSTGPPPPPFAAADTLFASVFSLLSDPFASGPKTPVGGNLSNTIPVAPAEMSDGEDLELPVTTLIRAWAAAEPDSMPELNVGVRLLPEGGSVTFWEYGDESDPARVPRLRLLVTPSTPFDLP